MNKLAPKNSRREDRELRVLLFADVHGYTELMTGDEAGTVKRVRRALDLFRKLIGDYGGKLIDTAGDSVLAVFPGAVGAVRCALALQEDFARERVWHAGGKPVRFRIGLHAGEVFYDGGAVRGLHVNVAQRVQSVARPGGVCVSEVVRGALPGDFEAKLRSIGTPPLKNVSRPIELFEIEVEGAGEAEDLVLIDGTGVANWQAPPARTTDNASVAVLPLDNLSGDPADRHLCDGLTSDVISDLSRFRDLVVIARHSTFAFRPNRQEDRHVVSKALNVRYLVTGGLRRAGGRLMLRVQLVEADSGQVLWSETVREDVEELLMIQEEVTGQLAFKMAVQVSAAERKRLNQRHRPELAVYGLILRGQDLSYRYRREANLHALRLFEQASLDDPLYARAYAGMSRTYNIAWRYRWHQDPEGCLDRAVELAVRATNEDEMDARGFSELGFAYLYKKRHDEALAAYERARDLNPNDADVLAEMGDMLVASGQPHQALGLLNRALRLNPLPPDWYLWNMAEVMFDLERYEQCVASLKRMRDQSQAHRLFAAANALMGRMDDAALHAREVLKVQPDFSTAEWKKVVPNRQSEAHQRYFEGLRKAGLK